MRWMGWNAAVAMGTGLCLLMAACGGGGTATTTTTTIPPIGPAITSVKVSPSPTTATIGSTVQFTATVAGTGSYDSTVTWTVQAPAGSSLSAGTLTKTGLYTTPYPAPATVTVTATSTQDTTQSGSATVTLSQPAATAGPTLSVDSGSVTHAINPFIYGMNAYQLDAAAVKAASLPLNRWGGDGASSYNYLLDVGNDASDWYFENFPGTTAGYPDISEFNTQVTQDKANGTRTMGTVPLLGWTPQRNTACSYSVTKYGAQKATDPYRADCGNGVLNNGNNVVNDPTDTYMTIDQTFVAGWVKYLVGKFGNAASGGVAIYDLDNEPSWWDAVHKDVHPLPFTYDELTAKSLAYAKAIKDNDPTAAVSGPVMDYWMDYFYSKKDIETGWASGPCNCANGNPTDRLAHGDVPLIEYYLQQFKKYQDVNGVRLLDYLDLHTYFAANNLGFSTAGDTTTQQARLNSTRVFWDPAYTDPNYTDPDNRTAQAPALAPQVINLMKKWVAADYPGTKLAITEYNWGGQEAISGALAQADILGIFGREGLDLGTLWGAPSPTTQLPGLMAFEVFRNYDGAGAQFGDKALTSTSVDQGKLAVYGALRTADDKLTVVVLNKTYGDLTATLTLGNLTPNGAVKVFLYSSANLAAIVAQPDVAVTQAAGSTSSTLSTTFPAQSITVLVVPKV